MESPRKLAGHVPDMQREEQKEEEEEEEEKCRTTTAGTADGRGGEQ